jgi:hypothetical protein
MNVEALMSNVASDLEPVARRARVRLSVRCDGGIVGSEAEDVAHSMRTIVTNVIRATARGGNVVLDVRKGERGIASWVVLRFDTDLTPTAPSFDGNTMSRSLGSAHDARPGRMARRAA